MATEALPRATTIRSVQFRLVIAMALLIMVGFGLIVPALPQFVKSLGHAETGIAVVVFGFSLTRLAGDLFAGALIDRYGERAMTALGAAIVGASSLAAGASQSYGQLVVLRGIGGFGSAFFLGGLMAYLVGTTPVHERGRAMSVFQASFGIGFLIGPALGGVLLVASDSARLPFYIYGAVLLASIPLILRALAPVRASASALAEPAPSLLQDETPPAPRAPAWRQLRPLLAHSAYRAALAASALIFLVSSVEITLFPRFWTEVLGESKGTSGLPFTVASLLGLVVVWHAGALTDRRGRKSALVPSLAATAVAVGAIGFTHSAWVVLALVAVHGAASGYMRPGPSAIVADISSPESRGVAVAGYRFAGDAGALLGPLLAGPIAQYVSYRAAFLVAGGLAAGVFLVAALARETAPARAA